MADIRKYAVRFRRKVVSTATVTVEARSKNEALWKAGKAELEWRDEPQEAEIDGIEVEGEG